MYRLNTVHPLAYVDSYPARSHRMENRNCHHSAGMPGAAYPHRPSFTLSWKREHLCLCLVLPFFLWTDKLIFRTSGHVQPLASTTPPKRSHAHSNLQLEGPQQFHSSCTCHLHFRNWHLLPIDFQNLFNPTEPANSALYDRFFISVLCSLPIDCRSFATTLSLTHPLL